MTFLEKNKENLVETEGLLRNQNIPTKTVTQSEQPKRPYYTDQKISVKVVDFLGGGRRSDLDSTLLKHIKMLVIFFYNLFEYIYACPIYVQNMKKIEGQFCYPIHPIPSHPEVKHFQDFKKANFRS